MSELKPCPFCGGDANENGWLNLDLESGPECSICGSTAATVEVWNTRHNENKVKAEAVRGIVKTLKSSESLNESDYPLLDWIDDIANKLEKGE